MKLTDNRTLWLLFIAVVLITVAFPIASSIWNVAFVDPIADPASVREAISAMSSEQRSVHAWITSTLDVAYPLAYGAFFAGSALAFFPRYGRWLAIPSFIVIPTDLAEGVVQVLALTEVTDWLGLKAILTPLKTVLFLVGLAITIGGWLAWSYARLRGRSV